MAQEALEPISKSEKQQNPNKSLIDGKQSELSEKVEGGKAPNMLDRLRDPKYRSKLKRSWMIAGAFFNMGLTVGLTGATLLDLQIITGTDLERASAFVTGYTGGFMTGCLVGGVIFSYMDVNLLLFMSVFGTGAALIGTPFCTNYILMIFMRVLCGFFAGGINTTCTAAHMQIWGSDGKVLMQVIQFTFAVGGVISPLYTEPFLAKRAAVDEQTEANLTRATSNATTPPPTTNDPEATNVHYAFIIAGVFITVTSLSFLVIFFMNRTKKSLESQTSGDNKASHRELPLPLHIFLLIMLCTIFTLYSSIEVSFVSFLIPFLVKEFEFVTKATGVLISATFWISLAASRFLMIFVSKFISTVSLLFTCLTLMLVAFIGFYICAIFGAIPALSVFTALAGLGMSGFYAAGFSWTESEVMKVTAKVTSCICVTSSSGCIVVPLLIAFLMEKLSNMWFCYVLICQTVNMFLLFVFVLLFNRLYVNKRYNSLNVCRGSVVFVENVQSLLDGHKV